MSLYTNDIYWMELDKPTKKSYKKLAKGRLCKRTIAQLVYESAYQFSLENALLQLNTSFEELTEDEQIVATYCFKKGQAHYISVLKKRALVDEKIHNNIRVIADIMKLTATNNSNDRPSLNFNLSQEGKNPPKKEKKRVSHEPLDLTFDVAKSNTGADIIQH